MTSTYQKSEPISDAYISVELRAQQLMRVREGLLSAFSDLGAEAPETGLHVSIAYGVGEVKRDCLSTAVNEIASRGFTAHATGFEILSGRSTDYDYLVLTLESTGDFQEARDIVDDHFLTRDFVEGFKGHVSLVRIPKGSLSTSRARAIVRELNASHGAAYALGRCFCLEGACVCAFNLQREVCLQVPISKAA